MRWARLAAFVLLQFSGAEAYAAGITLNNWQDINSVILCPIAVAMFWILMVLSIIMVIVAAFMYVTAAGNPERVGKATKTITYAAIGVAVALMARAFPLIIASIFSATGVQGCS